MKLGSLVDDDVPAWCRSSVSRPLHPPDLHIDATRNDIFATAQIIRITFHYSRLQARYWLNEFYYTLNHINKKGMKKEREREEEKKKRLHLHLRSQKHTLHSFSLSFSLLKKRTWNMISTAYFSVELCARCILWHMSLLRVAYICNLFTTTSYF